MTTMRNFAYSIVIPHILLFLQSYCFDQVRAFGPVERSVLKEGDIDSDTDSYPFSDALVASALPQGSNPSNSFSKEEAEDLLECMSQDDHWQEEDEDKEQTLARSLLKDASNKLDMEIFEIIDKAIGRSIADTGRILETVNTEFVVGQNYRTSIKGATISCFVTQSMDHKDVSAYASYVVASDATNLAPDPRAGAHNVSMFIEADVMESPASGLFFLPKRYCFDGLDKLRNTEAEKWGMSAEIGVAFDDSRPGIMGTSEHARTIQLGPKQASLLTRLHRLSRLITRIRSASDYDATWNETEKKEWEQQLVMRSYSTPKAELWALPQTGIFLGGDQNPCKGEYDPWYLIYDCVHEEVNKVLQQYSDLEDEANYQASMESVVTMSTMLDYLREWQKFLLDKHDDWTDEYLVENLQDGTFSEELMKVYSKTRNHLMYPVPMIFDRQVALKGKNTYLPAHEVNPFPGGKNVPYRQGGISDNSSCFVGHYTDAVRSAALHLEDAMLYRKLGRLGEPSPDIREWKISTGDVIANNSLAGEPYLDRPVSWRNGKDMATANLTKKENGKTASWLLVTPWYDEKESLQKLLERTQESSAPYSKAASDAYQDDNPCGSAASDADVFLFVLSMALAGFGGLVGVLQAMHRCFHWWTVAYNGVELDTSQHGNDKKSDQQNNKRRLLNPCLTYELLFVFIGTILFAALFTPLVLQTIREFEIANFRTTATAFDIQFSEHDQDTIIVLSLNQAAFVTLIYVETSCDTARPTLLLSLLIVGLIISIMANAPYIMRAVQAVKRAWCSSEEEDDKDEDEERGGHHVYSEELKVLIPVTVTDYPEEGQSIRDYVLKRPSLLGKGVGKNGNGSGKTNTGGGGAAPSGQANSSSPTKNTRKTTAMVPIVSTSPIPSSSVAPSPVSRAVSL